MARATAHDVSDSDNDSDRVTDTKKSASTSKTGSTNKGRGKDAAEKEEAEDEEGSEEDDEEEYEIEEILDAKMGTFPEGRIGYLVKWKGYGEEHNSWVDQKDAEGAKNLIAEYWTKKKQKGGPRKSDVRAKPGPKPRKSAAKDDDSDIEEVPPPKKRSRPSNGKAAAARTSDDGQDDEDAMKKKPRKSTAQASAKKAKRTAADDEDEDEETFVDMSLKNAKSWEAIVDTIDTVERADDGLYVYFTLKHGQGHGKATSAECAKKMPYKLIAFYEQNLRWKETEINEDAMED